MIEFVVSMENQPGKLAALTEALAALDVNIEALTAYGTDGEGTVRLIVDDAATTRRILDEAALSFHELTVLTATLQHRPGELARLTRAISNAGVNIDAIYVMRANADGVELAIAVDEPDAALPELEVLGGVGLD